VRTPLWDDLRVATVRDLGEAGVVEAVAARLTGGPQVLLGPGDDAAVVAAPDGRVVATTDVLVEGVHFRRDWSGPYDVGRRAAAANLADVAAMGAVGTALLVGLSAPGELPVDWALLLIDGLRDEAALVGAAVAGGDTVAGERVVVAVTALGDLQGRRPVRRSGARPGDVVVVAGELGGSAAGLAQLMAGARSGPLVQAHRRPQPRYAAGPALADLGATSMCDVSDGLVADLLSLTTASGVAVLLDVAAVPRPPGVTVQQALHGGEDHALLATLPPAAVDAATGLGAVAVGHVREGAGVRDLAALPLRPQGWEHWG